MKRFLTLALTVLALPALAGQWSIQTFLNPGVANAVMITNWAGGVGGQTNLGVHWQSYDQGPYAAGTNLAGANIIAPIQTNVFPLMFTNNRPITWNGQLLPGQLMIGTNNTLSTAHVTQNASNAPVQFFTLTTNDSYSAQNLFQDVYFNSDANMSFPLSPTTTVTNILGMLTIQVMPFFYPWAANTVTNIVQLVFEGIPEGPPNTIGAPWLAGQPSLGIDNLTAGGVYPIQNSATWAVSFTNSTTSLYAPYTAARPVPVTPFWGCRGMRVRAVGCGGTGVSTNMLMITRLTFSDWVP